MDIEYAIASTEVVEQFGPGQVLVVVLRAVDAVMGCGGSLLSHLDHGDPATLILAGDADEGGGRTHDPDVGLGDRFSDAHLLRWNLPVGDIRYDESLIARIQSVIDTTAARLIYTNSPLEPLPAHRLLALATAEAVRRSERDCHLILFEIAGQLRPNRLLDMSCYRGRKQAALASLAAGVHDECVRQMVDARDTCRALALSEQVTAAEAYLVIEAAALRADRAGGPASLWLTPAADSAGLPLPVPLISVIVRSIGRPELIEALNSVAAQTYPYLEVLVVQASSGPPLILPERLGHAALRLVREDRPLRRSEAANLGLRQARGEYLAFLDDDDWWLPEHLAVLADCLTRSSARGAYSGVRCVRRQDEAWEDVHLFNDPFDADRLLVDNFIPIHAVLFHRSLVDAGCAFDETLDQYEDWDFWLQIARQTPLHHDDRVTAIYRLGSGAGFGVTASEMEVEQALARFFAKWRAQWTELELKAIIERARAAQGVGVMQRQVRLVEGQRDQLSEYHHDAPARIAELEAGLHQVQERARAEQHRLRIAHRVEIDGLHEDWQSRNDALQTWHESVEAGLRTERDLARQTIEELYRSTSWRLTAPVRAMRRGLRSVQAGGRALFRFSLGGLRNLYRQRLSLEMRQRLRPTVAQIAARLPLIEAFQTAADGPEPYHPLRPFPLVKIRQAQFASWAGSFDFPTSETPEVSVIVPVYGNPGYTLECLASMALHPPHAPFEIILIDDASAEEDRRLLRSIRGVRLLENDANLGFLRSCNRAAAAARGRYLLFLNNDTQVREGWLDRLVEPFADPEVGMTGSKLLYPSGHLQEAGVCMASDGAARLVGLNGDPNAPEYNFPREVDYCSGASVMIERAVFERLGGFDERFAPAYFEDADLAFQVRALGRRILYQPASEVIHHLSVTTGAAGDKLARIETNRTRFIEKWQTQLDTLDQVRLIAFYLPQYHPIPENDAWWGKGFTEWTNVARARPNFEGHDQPQRPADLGYYDLRLAEVRQQQADMALAAGIHGFCYYYYWFNGHRLLHRPLDEMLASGQPNFPFCLCWANENWSRRWDGREKDLLMEQHYTPEDDLAFIRALLPVLADPRYIRINGRPFLLVYRASLLPDAQATTDRWRAECQRAGLAEPYIACVHSFHEHSDLTPGFDAEVEFPPHGHSIRAPAPERMLNPHFKGHFYDYPATARAFAALHYPDRKVFRGVMPAWDNTARRQNDGHIFLNASPEHYEEWLRRMIAETREQRFGDERLLFVNAWNEWAEGNHLEPDMTFGFRYLDATRRALDAVIAPRRNA